MYGYTHDKDNYIKRLRRIEGQIRGLQRMVEQDKYCIDILTQVAAATKALQSVALGLLEEHLGTASSRPSPKAATPRPTRSGKHPTRSPG
jgi:DNA-binding FrmR family transcriptional regulator